MTSRPRAFVRDIDAGQQLQSLLVWSILSVLVTRLYLELTGYPKIGGGGLHLAHLLWGGLLMLAALIIQLSLVGRRRDDISAIVGGIGFGLFIDEIGKFITSDNDYFFEPALALIYLIFVVLFLIFRAVEARTASSEDRLVNAAAYVPDLIHGTATTSQAERARALLVSSGRGGPMVDALLTIIDNAELAADQPGRMISAARWTASSAQRFLAWQWAQRAVILVFLVQAAIGVGVAAIVGFTTIQFGPEEASAALDLGTMNALQTGGLVGSVVSFVLVLIGVVRLPRSRIAAYRWFERSLLASIFVTQILLFWQDQFAAAGGFAFNMVLLAGLRAMLGQETGPKAGPSTLELGRPRRSSPA